MIMLADAQPDPYQTLSAFPQGAACDLSTALALRARDVDLQRKEVRAAGPKTHPRERVVRVAEWAWPYMLVRVAPLKATGTRATPPQFVRRARARRRS